MAQMLRLPQVQQKTGLARATIYLKISRGEFPQPVQLSERRNPDSRGAVAWVEAEVDQWLEARMAQRCGQALAA